MIKELAIFENNKEKKTEERYKITENMRKVVRYGKTSGRININKKYIGKRVVIGVLR